MKISKFLLTAAAAAILATSGAAARDRDHDGRPDHSWSERHDRDGYNDAWRGRADWHWRDHRGSWHNDRDRYWRPGYGRYVGHDRVYVELRRNHYHRWAGPPYWYRGHYVVRSYDRYGRAVFVEMNPYTGRFVGVIRF